MGAEESFVHPAARVAKDASIGPGCRIAEGVEIGAGVVLGVGVVVHPGVVMEAGCSAGDYSVLGKPPKLSPSSTVAVVEGVLPLLIGEGTRIGSHVIVCCGSRIGREATIADFALVRERVEIGDGAVVGSQVVVENDVRIGRAVKIQSKAYVTAMSSVDDFAFIAPCVIMANDNFMGRTQERFKLKGGPKVHRGARVGAGSLLLPNIVVGEEAFVAAGSIVTRNVPARKLVMGSPARVVRDVPEKEWADNQ